MPEWNRSNKPVSGFVCQPMSKRRETALYTTKRALGIMPLPKAGMCEKFMIWQG